MACALLPGAGVLEVVRAFAMKQPAGFTRRGPTAVMTVSMAGWIVLLTLSMRRLPPGTACAVWTGIGTVGAFALGIGLPGEAATPMGLAAAPTIVAGLVLMRRASDG